MTEGEGRGALFYIPQANSSLEGRGVIAVLFTSPPPFGGGRVGAVLYYSVEGGKGLSSKGLEKWPGVC